MLEKLMNLPRGIVGVKAVGKVTKEDYESVFEPMVQSARKEGRRIRLIYQLGSEFETLTPSAAWEDAKIGLQFTELFEACAVVTDLSWLRESMRLFHFFMPCPVRAFGNQELDQAVAWLSALPQQGAISHRLLTEAGVIVVEVKHALRAQDFDALARTADAWIQAHGDLQGVVIHAREFPGWENLGGLLRHIGFVRDHQSKVKKIALVADGKLLSLVPRLADHFVKAELKHFPYDALDTAIAWASLPRAASQVVSQAATHSA